jgi:hypothetical protein
MKIWRPDSDTYDEYSDGEGGGGGSTLVENPTVPGTYIPAALYIGETDPAIGGDDPYLWLDPDSLGGSGSSVGGALTYIGGVLGSDVACATGTTTTVMTTTSLATGTWLFQCQIYLDVNPSAGDVFDLFVVAGSATVAFTGPTGTGMQMSGSVNPRGSLHIQTIVTVTTEGTLLIRARMNLYTATAKVASISLATAGISGWTALKIA